MDQIAPYYKEKMEGLVSKVTKLLEPVIIVGMGVTIAGLMRAEPFSDAGECIQIIRLEHVPGGIRRRGDEDQARSRADAVLDAVPIDCILRLRLARHSDKTTVLTVKKPVQKEIRHWRDSFVAGTKQRSKRDIEPLHRTGRD